MTKNEQMSKTAQSELEMPLHGSMQASYIWVQSLAQNINIKSKLLNLYKWLVGIHNTFAYFCKYHVILKYKF